MFLHIYLQSRDFAILLFSVALFSLSIPGYSTYAQSSQAVDEDVLFRVNAGGASVEDWDEDTDAMASPWLLAGSTSIYTNGQSPPISSSVPEGTPEALFNTVRLDATKADPQMEWDFPVVAGQTLNVRLYFIEWTRCTLGERVFDVEIEGDVVLDDFDIYNNSDNRCHIAIMRSFEVTPADNNLDINFPLVNGKPSSIAGIEILIASAPEGPEVSRISGNESRGYSGDGGPAIEAQMNDPRGIVHDAFGNLYIADSENNVDFNRTMLCKINC